MTMCEAAVYANGTGGGFVVYWGSMVVVACVYVVRWCENAACLAVRYVRCGRACGK